MRYLSKVALCLVLVSVSAQAKGPSPSRLAFSPDGALLAVSTQNQDEVVVYQSRSLDRVHALPQAGLIGALAFDPGASSLATGAGVQVRLWNAATGEVEGALSEAFGEIRSLAFSRSGALLASGTMRGTMRLWDVAQQRLLWTYDKSGPFTVEAVAFSPDERLVASLLDDTALRLWDVASQEQVGLFRGALAGAVAFSPDGQWIAAGSARALSGAVEHAVRLWDVATQEEVAYLRGHSGRIESIDFSPDGALMITASRDSTVQLWDMTELRSLGAFRGHRAPVGTAAFDPAGERIASVDQLGRVLLSERAVSTAVEAASWGQVKAGR